nr:nucleotidyl transferase AbiEii/AbiGii toxin family protein [Paenibacillus elgii]
MDFGRHEYCGDITETELEGFTVPIYTPTLILLEKIRAICQQMEDYLISIGKESDFARPRPRDFYDIYTILTHPSMVQIDFSDPELLKHLRECFRAKRVPLAMISKISETRNFHKQDENKLRDSILNKREFKGFDFYFDYVVSVLTENNLTGLTEVA